MVNGRAVVCREADEISVGGTEGEEEEEEKKRKAKAEAAERAMQVTSTREMKMMELVVFLWCGLGGSVAESVLKERREVDGLGGSSRVGICVGFVDVKAEPEPMFSFHFLFLGSFDVDF